MLILILSSVYRIWNKNIQGRFLSTSPVGVRQLVGIKTYLAQENSVFNVSRSSIKAPCTVFPFSCKVFFNTFDVLSHCTNWLTNWWRSMMVFCWIVLFDNGIIQIGLHPWLNIIIFQGQMQTRWFITRKELLLGVCMWNVITNGNQHLF